MSSIPSLHTPIYIYIGAATGVVTIFVNEKGTPPESELGLIIMAGFGAAVGVRVRARVGGLRGTVRGANFTRYV